MNSAAPDPTANPFWDDVIMRYPRDNELNENQRPNWPQGIIDLRGPAY